MGQGVNTCGQGAAPFYNSLAGALASIHVIHFKEASGRFFFYFLEVLKKCIGYIRIFFIHFR